MVKAESLQSGQTPQQELAPEIKTGLDDNLNQQYEQYAFQDQPEIKIEDESSKDEGGIGGGEPIV